MSLPCVSWLGNSVLRAQSARTQSSSARAQYGMHTSCFRIPASGDHHWNPAAPRSRRKAGATGRPRRSRAMTYYAHVRGADACTVSGVSMSSTSRGGCGHNSVRQHDTETMGNLVLKAAARSRILPLMLTTVTHCLGKRSLERSTCGLNESYTPCIKG